MNIVLNEIEEKKVKELTKKYKRVKLCLSIISYLILFWIGHNMHEVIFDKGISDSIFSSENNHILYGFVLYGFTFSLNNFVLSLLAMNLEKDILKSLKSRIKFDKEIQVKYSLGKIKITEVPEKEVKSQVIIVE